MYSSGFMKYMFMLWKTQQIWGGNLKSTRLTYHYTQAVANWLKFCKYNEIGWIYAIL